MHSLVQVPERVFSRKVARVIFRQFCTDDGDISYLLADPVTRYAALLDPHVDARADYGAVFRRLELRLVYLIETHLHESHLSATPALRAHTDAQVVAHNCIDLVCVDRRVVDGECIFMGEERINAMETPGHSACSMSYQWRDRVFTGHTLLAGATGPCQRDDADAARLFDSVRDRLFVLPKATLVCPGRVTGRRRRSTIGDERAGNADLRPRMTRARFVAAKRLELAQGRVWQIDSLENNRGCGFFV
jgi:sulfur dioxygenase